MTKSVIIEAGECESPLKSPLRRLGKNFSFVKPKKVGLTQNISIKDFDLLTPMSKKITQTETNKLTAEPSTPLFSSPSPLRIKKKELKIISKFSEDMKKKCTSVSKESIKPDSLYVRKTNKHISLDLDHIPKLASFSVNRKLSNQTFEVNNNLNNNSKSLNTSLVIEENSPTKKTAVSRFASVRGKEHSVDFSLKLPSLNRGRTFPNEISVDS